jgi:hypothetical protein
MAFITTEKATLRMACGTLASAQITSIAVMVAFWGRISAIRPVSV